MISYWELLWRRRRYLKLETTNGRFPQEGYCNITIGPHARHTLDPRGEAVPDDPTGAYDFGLGAGFYVDATEEPFASNYRMWTLPASSRRRLLLTKGR
jgi:hypothetical protein